MDFISDDELMCIDGGAIRVGFLLGAAALISFLTGVLDGFFRPLKCR